MTELEAGLEAVLFAAGDAVPVDRLAAALESTREELLQVAESLASSYDFDRRGIMLIRMEDKLQLASRPAFADSVRRITESRRPPSLSSAALEVLTIVAYRQPVTRAFIDQLRGVDSGGTVSSLADKGMIEEAGRLDVPGRPILYRTTDIFLRTFSLSSLGDLPALPSLEENEQMKINLDGDETDTPLDGQVQMQPDEDGKEVRLVTEAEEVAETSDMESSETE